MIYEIRIKNFKSIRSARLDFHLNADGSPDHSLDNEFKNLLVLVGQNGSGKSNFVDAIQFSLDTLNQGFEKSFEDRGGFSSVHCAKALNSDPIGFEIQLNAKGQDWVWGYQREESSNYDYEWCFSFDTTSPLKGSFLNVSNKTIRHSFFHKRKFAFLLEDTICHTITKGKTAEVTRFLSNNFFLIFASKHFSKVENLVRDFLTFSSYSLFPNTLKLPQKVSKAKMMHRHGENWAAVLKGMNPAEEGRELIAALGQLVGDIDDYRVIEAGGYLIPEFHHQGDGEGLWRGASQESDGTVRLAALLTALLQKPTPKLICLEEPELGVHPGSLRLLMDFVKQALHETQIIITTHSPELIDLVPPECLRVVTREGGESKISRLHPDQMTMLKQHLCTSSELWGMEGLLPTEAPDPGSPPNANEAADASAHE